MTNITMKSSKEDIATASLEIIDSQSEELATLKQQQRILFAVLSILMITGVLF